MGRYPFTDATLKYLATRRGIVAKSTYTEDERKLRYIGRVLEELRSKGMIKNVNPSKIERGDMQEFLLWMRENELDPETQLKYLHHLNSLLRFCKNHVLDDMKAEGVRLPSKPRKKIRTVSENNLEKIQCGAEKIQGWRGDIARFLAWVYPNTGLRPSELRLAQIEDLNVDSWELLVRHPKGEGSWAERRTVIILPPARPAVLRYLEARRRHILERGLKEKDVEALIPNLSVGVKGYYTSNFFRVTKKRIETVAGVEFRLKDFRPTFAQMSLDLNPNLLPDVSTVLGHANLQTTQRYYAQIRGSTARQRLEEAWTATAAPNPMEPKKPLIDDKKYLSGYA